MIPYTLLCLDLDRDDKGPPQRENTRLIGFSVSIYYLSFTTSFKESLLKLRHIFILLISLSNSWHLVGNQYIFINNK